MPAENALSGALPKRCGLQGLDGGRHLGSNWRPTSQSSNLSPPSSGNGNFRRRDGHAKTGLTPSRDQFRDARECEKPPFRRNNCEDADGSLSPETAWWAHRARTWDR
jgi:hypothetical protein